MSWARLKDYCWKFQYKKIQKKHTEWHYCAYVNSRFKKLKLKTQTKTNIVNVNSVISDNSVRVECNKLKSFNFAYISFCDTFISTKENVKI